MIRVEVPPYTLSESITLSPAAAKFATVKKTAACPLEVAIAALPPSSAATLVSKTSQVFLFAYMSFF